MGLLREDTTVNALGQALIAQVSCAPTRPQAQGMTVLVPYLRRDGVEQPVARLQVA